MKALKSLLMAGLLAATVGVAWADHGHFAGHSGGQFSGQFSGHFNGHFAGRSGGHLHGHEGIGVLIGAPLFDPWLFPPPYYYDPAVVVVPASQQLYVERSDAARGVAGYWYFCGNPRGYYPYVRECPTGWQQVAPAPM